MLLSSCEATTIVYRFLVKTVAEADIDLVTKLQMNFTGLTIFSMEWCIEYCFMLVLMLRQDSLPSFYWTRGRSMLHVLALGLLPSVLQISPSGHVSHTGSLRVPFCAY